MCTVKRNERNEYCETDHDNYLSYEGELYTKMDKKLIRYKGEVYYCNSTSVYFNRTTLTSRTVRFELEAMRPDRNVGKQDGVTEV